MFSNNLYGLSKGENKVYTKNLIEWLSEERGTTRIVSASYSCINDLGQDSECPKKSRFRMNVTIEYWDWNSKKWAPYSDDNINFEMTLMSHPKFRRVLKEDKKGTYSLIGKINDRMGTYRMKLNHNRPGWNRIWYYKKLLVRNKNYKEYVKYWARDLVSAAGFLAVPLSFTVVSLIYLYSDDRVKLLN